VSLGAGGRLAQTGRIDGSQPQRRESDEESLMNQQTKTERCHDPMIMLTRCHLEDLDRELARCGHMRLVRSRH
jgi:hypothetical protein